MEDGAPMASGDINKNICQECGLTLKVDSYTKINPNTEQEKIILNLVCPNPDHKAIKELNFQEYQALINISMNKICKCTLCNSLQLNRTEFYYYCYNCKKIICSDCLNDKHEKEHKNFCEYKDIENKCLNHFDDKNEIIYYCLICKKNLCQMCIIENLDHFKQHNIKKITDLKEETKPYIIKIQEEQYNNIKQKHILQEKLKNLENKIEFADFLQSEKDNYFYLLYDNNNKIINSQKNSNNMFIKNQENVNQMNNNNIYNNKEIKGINIIYLDENLKYGSKEIISDCQRIQNQTKGTLILVNDLINFCLLLKNLTESKTTCKFILIVNGSSADNAVTLVKKKNYQSLFINACIYTGNLNKYEKIKNKHSDLIGTICIDCQNIIMFINANFQKINTEKYYINSIINFYTYKNEYCALHKVISLFYGDKSQNTFSVSYQIINDFIQNCNFNNNIKENLLHSFQNFQEITQNNYEKIIITYLKDDNLSKILNSELMKKDMSVYSKIGYFVGNLMFSLVEYGNKNKKAVNKTTILYKGMQLNIVDLLEFLKNSNYLITFPYFLSLKNKKEFAEIISKRNISDKERKEKEFYSVIITITYLYDDEYEPSVFNLKDLAQYPDEEEYILLPFTFLELNKINIDSNKFIADIELDIIGKKDILEDKIKDSKTVDYDTKKKIMFIK